MATKKQEIDAVLSEDSRGCLARSMDDEPVFVLCARDSTAPAAVRAWARGVIDAAASSPSEGLTQRQATKIAEAEALAQSMERWQKVHGSKVPD